MRRGVMQGRVAVHVLQVRVRGIWAAQQDGKEGEESGAGREHESVLHLERDPGDAARKLAREQECHAEVFGVDGDGERGFVVGVDGDAVVLVAGLDEEVLVRVSELPGRGWEASVRLCRRARAWRLGGGVCCCGLRGRAGECRWGGS
jgi:hypothetical protein